MLFGLDIDQSPEYYENLAPPYIVGLIVTTAFATIALAFRIYAQWLIRNLKAWDNIFAILAFVCGFVDDTQQILTVATVESGTLEFLHRMAIYQRRRTACCKICFCKFVDG